MRGKGRSHEEGSQEDDDSRGVRKVGGGRASSEVTGEVDGVSPPQPVWRRPVVNVRSSASVCRLVGV